MKTVEQLQARHAVLQTKIREYEAANDNATPGVYITGRDGISAKRLQKQAEALERTIDRSLEYAAWLHELEQIESQIRAIDLAPEREAARQTAKTKHDLMFATIQAGDLINVGGNNLLTVARKNKKSVVTVSGTKYMASEVLGFEAA